MRALFSNKSLETYDIFESLMKEMHNYKGQYLFSDREQTFENCCHYLGYCVKQERVWNQLFNISANSSSLEYTINHEPRTQFMFWYLCESSQNHLQLPYYFPLAGFIVPSNSEATVQGTALHCTALHCTALHWTEPHCTALHCTAVELCAIYNVTQYIAVQYIVVQCSAVKYSVLH